MRPVCLFPLALAALLAAPSAAQEAPADAPTVFVDCRTFGCDEDFFQTEVGFARYVRDRADADVYVLVTEERTGGGGPRLTLFVEGRRGLAGRRDTLTTTLPVDATADDARGALARRLALGIAALTADTPLADRLRITAADTGAGAEPAASPADDPWDGWVFRLSGSGFFNGEQRTRFANVYGDVTAERVTEAWKLSVYAFGSRSRNEFEIDSATTFTSTSSGYGGNGRVVRSLSGHWSAGVTASARASSYENYDLVAEAGPAVEYDLFPYRESTRRQLRFLYALSLQAADYTERTIFGRTSEVRPRHALTTAAAFTQPWGSVDAALVLSQALDRPEKNRAQLRGTVSLRLARGLSFDLSGSYARVRDQLYLAAGDLPPEEILTQQRALATSYTYFGSVGLSYTFGSVFNSVVNPRFGG